MSGSLRFMRVYVTDARAGDIPMGFREVIEIDGEGLYPSVFYLGTMSLCALLKEDYAAAVEREVTPAMCKSMQTVLSRYKFTGTVPDRDDAVMRIQAWLRKLDAAAVPRQRHRVAASEPAQATTATRTRSRPLPPSVEEHEPVHRSRSRTIVQAPVAAPVARTRTRVTKQ